jgi:glycine/D-amino acid oxidase-like deaminating enzyme
MISQYGFSSPGGILSRQAAVTDAYLLTHALLQNSIPRGLNVYDRTRIDKIEYKKKGVRLTTTHGPVISARYVVNASGYEITEFIDKKIVTLHSTYALVSENLSPDLPLWKDSALLWNTADPYLYIRMTRDKRIMIGGRDEPFYNPVRRDKLINIKSAFLKKDFSKLFPDINLLPEFRWAGTFGSTKDALPYIGTYDKTPHTYYALGFGGNGITFSVIGAQIIRDLLTGRKNKDMGLFSFNR